MKNFRLTALILLYNYLGKEVGVLSRWPKKW